MNAPTRIGPWIGYVLGSAALVVIFLAAFFAAESMMTLNLLIVVTGGLIGWAVGMLMTPVSPTEKKHFPEYGKAISTFLSGYLVAKLDKLFEPMIFKAGINHFGADCPIVAIRKCFRSRWLEYLCLAQLCIELGATVKYGATHIGPGKGARGREASQGEGREGRLIGQRDNAVSVAQALSAGRACARAGGPVEGPALRAETAASNTGARASVLPKTVCLSRPAVRVLN
jgi:hypothetical protein